MEKPTIVAIAGSIRRGSFNRAILEALASRVSDRANVQLHSIADLPLYSEDLEGGDLPAPVHALRTAIGSARGVVIASPEYNHGMSGVLKNALDWASRPHGQSVMIGKPVLTLTASPAGTGGVRAHAQLNETLLAMTARLVSGPQVVVTAAHTKMKDGAFVNADTLSFLEQGFDKLLELCR